jgi:4-diphosphocytidyl-2-C-methyl-D-erythritol kinase
MKFWKINSYAKINLSLNIVGKLKNKLHKIESLVSFLDLKDEIYLKKINSKKHKIYFKGKFSNNIKKKNTITELLRLIDKKKLLNDKKFEIKIIKNIPQKSGMGGGSMNVASLMSFFIKKNFFQIKKKELIELNNSIGSDVILGMNKKNTVLSSNGSITRYNYNLNYYVIVAKPDFGCSTKVIYSKVKYFSKSKYNFPKKNLFLKKIF